MYNRMPRSTRRRTLRGGGTASWSFAPESADRTMNNAMAWAPSSCGAPPSVSAHLGGGGLPGLSTGAGVSLQKGGAHYGFMPNGGLAGGNQVLSNSCAPHQSGASGQLNVPQNAMGGGRRTNKKNAKKSKSKKSKSKKSKSKKSRR